MKSWISIPYGIVDWAHFIHNRSKNCIPERPNWTFYFWTQKTRSSPIICLQQIIFHLFFNYFSIISVCVRIRQLFFTSILRNVNWSTLRFFRFIQCVPEWINIVAAVLKNYYVDVRYETDRLFLCFALFILKICNLFLRLTYLSYIIVPAYVIFFTQKLLLK